MKSSRKKIIVVLLCLFFGCILGTGGLSSILMFWGIGFLLWLFFLLILPFFMNHTHWRLVSSIFLTISLWLISSLGFMLLKSSYNSHSKTQLLGVLTDYKEEVGTYPNDLAQLIPAYYYFPPNYVGVWKLDTFDYIYTAEKDEFIIQCSIDGFVLEYYKSEVGYWNSTSGISALTFYLHQLL